MMTKRAWEASSSGERWPPEVLPEHTIFLSHSGHDKPFVERLCEELKRLNYTPFFDQNSDSLPKGERFPPHLFKAAKQCLLAVIVLSEDYLTSKWPMLELAAFVKARETKNPHMKLLPLFYKLSPSDLVPEKWMESWKKLAEAGKIHAKEIELWSKGVEVLMKARNVETERMKSLTEHSEQDEILSDDFLKLLDEVVKDLRPFNGLEFSNYGTSEGRYVKAVVDEIWKIIPLVVKYKTDWIRGYQRICEKTSSLFEVGIPTNEFCQPGPLCLGLYGMGGVGKTTLCEAMCSFYQEEFRGRVCHVELQNDSGYERMERLKHVIRKLGGLDDRVLQGITREYEGWGSLKERLKSQPPAFLAVDNVGDSESSRAEARRFISCGLACGSKNGNPLLPCEDLIVEACIEECKFFDYGYDMQQYNPLVLRALGSFFDVNRLDIMEWKKALMSDKKLQASRAFKHVNVFLGLNYANLTDGQKLLFLDVVLLFNHENMFLDLMDGVIRPWEDKYQWAISLLAATHGISTFEADLEVKELQRKSFIYESSPLRTHDLYIEFARFLVSIDGSKEKEWWVGHRYANRFNTTLKRLVLLNDYTYIRHPPMQFGECPVFTRRKQLPINLDLKCFPMLRVLIFYDFTHTAFLSAGDVVMDFDINLYGVKNRDKGCLPELRMVILCGLDNRRIPFLRHCWNLTFLSIDNFDFDFDILEDVASLFENLKALETLLLYSRRHGRFPFCVFLAVLQCATQMKKLKYLEIDPGCSEMGEHWSGRLNLSAFGSLIALSLPNLPSYVTEFKGLNLLTQLTALRLEASKGLRKLPNLKQLLPSLLQICLAGCVNLKHPGNELERFQKLHSRLYGHQCLKPGEPYIFRER